MLAYNKNPNIIMKQIIALIIIFSFFGLGCGLNIRELTPEELEEYKNLKNKRKNEEVSNVEDDFYDFDLDNDIENINDLNRDYKAEATNRDYKAEATIRAARVYEIIKIRGIENIVAEKTIFIERNESTQLFIDINLGDVYAIIVTSDNDIKKFGLRVFDNDNFFEEDKEIDIDGYRSVIFLTEKTGVHVIEVANYDNMSGYYHVAVVKE